MFCNGVRIKLFILSFRSLIRIEVPLSLGNIKKKRHDKIIFRLYGGHGMILKRSDSIELALWHGYCRAEAEHDWPLVVHLLLFVKDFLMSLYGVQN